MTLFTREMLYKIQLYFISSTSQHSRREASCQGEKITNKAKGRSVQHFFEFDLFLPLMYTHTHTEPNQTILFYGRGLQLNVSKYRQSHYLMKGGLLTPLCPFKSTSSLIFQG